MLVETPQILPRSDDGRFALFGALEADRGLQGK